MSCNSSRQAPPNAIAASIDVTGKSVASVPYALVYRTNGAYNNNVPLTLNDDGSRIISYPDPRDVASGNVAPVVLNKGYLLDRRGIGTNTAFLDYTYEEYASLEKSPSVEELMKHIIARDAVIELYRLPLTMADALKNPERCNEFVANGFKGCTKIK